MDRCAGNRVRAGPPAFPVDLRHVASLLEASRHAGTRKIWHAGLDCSPQYVAVPATAAAVLSLDRPALSRLAGNVGAVTVPFHASAAVLDRRRRPAFSRLLHRIHADRFSYVRCGIHARAARRLVPALALAVAALLLSPDDVRRLVPRGDGRRAGQIGWLARRRTRG